eukprot:gene9289-6530_t
MKLIVFASANSTKKEEINLPANATLEDLKKAYRPKMSIYRKSFKVLDTSAAAAPKSPIQNEVARPKLVTLSGNKPLADMGLTDGHEVFFKDLGPQIGYRTVFLVEYAGPLAFIIFYAARPTFVYGVRKPLNSTQIMFVSLFAAHFIKRELESIFVHKFSHPTMPFHQIFKNSFYYWSFAAFIGYRLCHPLYTAPANFQQSIAGGAFMIVNELLNFAVHMQLSLLRKGDGDQARKYPGGPLFALVTCPNYFHEVMSWVGFSIGTNIFSSWFFTFMGLLQMTAWSLKKRNDYVKKDPKLKKKKAILPFII